MAERIDLQNTLTDILGSKNVYYQPPESVKLSYPCILFELSNYIFDHADNTKYRGLKKYSITLISKEPDPATMDKILKLKYSSFDRYYISDNLYHYNFELYY